MGRVGPIGSERGRRASYVPMFLPSSRKEKHSRWLFCVTLICMSDVTRILSQIEAGDPSAAEQLLPLVYVELRKLAAAKLAH